MTKISQAKRLRFWTTHWKVVKLQVALNKGLQILDI